MGRFSVSCSISTPQNSFTVERKIEDFYRFFLKVKQTPQQQNVQVLQQPKILHSIIEYNTPDNTRKDDLPV